MGITNFTLLFPPIHFQPTNRAQLFDSILIDAQSLFYMAITESFEKRLPDIIRDIQYRFVRTIAFTLANLLDSAPHPLPDTVHVVISMDGESVPMKFETQRKRREVRATRPKKELLHTVLFGHNSISLSVYRYLLASLQQWPTFRHKFLPWTRLPSRLVFVLSGSDMPGEGEHKLFYVADQYALRRPVVASVDNDVFLVALLRTFESVQIVKSRYKVYHLDDLVRRHLPYDPYFLVRASLLFGNDFVPALVTLSPTNVEAVHEAIGACDDRSLPHIFRTVLQALDDAGKIRFDRVSHVPEAPVIAFFKVCLWILDYYTRKDFQQKYLHNSVYADFDRNLLITALLDAHLGPEACEAAQREYAAARPTPPHRRAHETVFRGSQLADVRPYLLDGRTDCLEEVTVECVEQRD